MRILAELVPHISQTFVLFVMAPEVFLLKQNNRGDTDIDRVSLSLCCKNKCRGIRVEKQTESLLAQR